MSTVTFSVGDPLRFTRAAEAFNVAELADFLRPFIGQSFEPITIDCGRSEGIEDELGQMIIRPHNRWIIIRLFAYDANERLHERSAMVFNGESFDNPPGGMELIQSKSTSQLMNALGQACDIHNYQFRNPPSSWRVRTSF